MAREEQRNIALNFITNATQTKAEVDSLMSSLDNTSDEFKELQQQSASLDSAITDLNNAMNATSGSSNILNTSISKLEGEMDRANESVRRLNNTTKQQTSTTDKQVASTKTLTKEVTENGGAMAILDMITGGWASTTRDAIEATALFTAGTNLSTIAQRAYTFVVGTSTGALKAFRIALAATGIGAIVVLVGFLVEAFMNLTSATDEATDAQRRLNAEMANNQYEETISRLEFLAEVRKEQAREQGASITEIRELERKASEERLKELDRQRRDERLTSDQVEKAGQAYLDQQRKIVLQEARWRADDAEASRNSAKDTANARTKISQDNSAELRRIEEERITFLKKIETDYRDWLDVNQAVNPSKGLLAQGEINYRKLQEQRDADLKDVEKYVKDNKEKYTELTTTINNYYDVQLNRLKAEKAEILGIEEAAYQLGIENISNRNEYDINAIQSVYKKTLEFVEGIKNADLKQYYSEVFNIDRIKQSQALIEKYKEDVYELSELKPAPGTIFANELFGGDSDAKSSIESRRDENARIYNLMMEQALSEAELLEASEAEKQLIRAKYSELTIKNSEEATQALLDIDRIQKQQQLQALDAYGQALGATAGLMEEHTAGYKTLAIAQTTIDTYTSAMGAYRGMVQAIPGPVGIAAGIAAAAASVITGISNVKKILAVKVPGGGSSGGGVPSSASVTPNVNFVSSSENQIANSVAGAMNNSNQEPIKAYVVANDVTTAQQLEQKAIQSNSL